VKALKYLGLAAVAEVNSVCTWGRIERDFLTDSTADHDVGKAVGADHAEALHITLRTVRIVWGISNLLDAGEGT
jgi:hypothetical protein